MLIFCFIFIYLFLFYFTVLYWFCHTLTWIHHGCTWVPNPEPHFHLSPHIISLGHPSAPAPARQLKRHRCIEQTCGLCGRGRGWDNLVVLIFAWHLLNVLFENIPKCIVLWIDMWRISSFGINNQVLNKNLFDKYFMILSHLSRIKTIDKIFLLLAKTWKNILGDKSLPV